MQWLHRSVRQHGLRLERRVGVQHSDHGVVEGAAVLEHLVVLQERIEAVREEDRKPLGHWIAADLRASESAGPQRNSRQSIDQYASGCWQAGSYPTCRKVCLLQPPHACENP